MALVKANANPNIVDERRRNALHWAINNNTSEDTSFEVEELLISSGTSLNARDSRGRSPIFYFFAKIGAPFASQRRDPVEIFSDFIEFPGAELDLEDDYGRTPLSYACQRGSYLCASILCKRGARIDHADGFGNTPLAIALLNGHIDLALFLLQGGADPSVCLHEVDTASMLEYEKLRKPVACKGRGTAAREVKASSA